MLNSSRIQLPTTESLVAGFDIYAETGVEPDTVADGQIAHNEYIRVTIFSDGTNPGYTEVDNPDVLLFFVEPHVHFMVGKHNGVMYASIHSDFGVEKLDLVEEFENPQLLGVLLRVWSIADSEEPVCELCVARLQTGRN